MREQIFPTLKIGCINSLATAAAGRKVATRGANGRRNAHD